MTKQEGIPSGIDKTTIKAPSKQEEIVEEVAKICLECEFWHWDWESLEPDVKEDYLQQARQILSYLHSQGVVIKVERELAKAPRGDPYDDFVNGYYQALEDMAGYVAVESLIGE